MNTTTTAVPTVSFNRALGRYTLDVYPLGATFNDVPAVYVITRRDHEGMHYVIYVGQTENIRARFADHHKWDCMMRLGANSICAAVVHGELQRFAMENDLVQAYSPPCNG